MSALDGNRSTIVLEFRNAQKTATELAIYLPVWLAGVGRFDRTYLGKVLTLLPMAMVAKLLTALGQEIGWRNLHVRD